MFGFENQCASAQIVDQSARQRGFDLLDLGGSHPSCSNLQDTFAWIIFDRGKVNAAHIARGHFCGRVRVSPVQTENSFLRILNLALMLVH